MEIDSQRKGTIRQDTLKNSNITIRLYEDITSKNTFKHYFIIHIGSQFNPQPCYLSDDIAIANNQYDAIKIKIEEIYKEKGIAALIDCSNYLP